MLDHMLDWYSCQIYFPLEIIINFLPVSSIHVTIFTLYFVDHLTFFTFVKSVLRL